MPNTLFHLTSWPLRYLTAWIGSAIGRSDGWMIGYFHVFCRSVVPCITSIWRPRVVASVFLVADLIVLWLFMNFKVPPQNIIWERFTTPQEPSICIGAWYLSLETQYVSYLTYLMCGNYTKSYVYILVYLAGNIFQMVPLYAGLAFISNKCLLFFWCYVFAAFV